MKFVIFLSLEIQRRNIVLAAQCGLNRRQHFTFHSSFQNITETSPSERPRRTLVRNELSDPLLPAHVVFRT
jgi:hypothetical protein